MLEAGTGLFRRRGKSAGKSCGINEIRIEVVFRDTDDYCTHNPNEISPLHSEVVFRDIPGKLVQWRRQSQRLRRLLCLRRAPVNSPGDGIAWVPVAPPRLRLLPATGLTFRRVAGPLPVSCSRTRPEPPAADPAWSLPGLWAGTSSASSRASARSSSARPSAADSAVTPPRDIRARSVP